MSEPVKLLTSELAEIRIGMSSIYQAAKDSETLSDCLLSFDNVQRTSMQLFEHRRGCRVDKLESASINILETLASSLSEDLLERVASLFETKGNDNYYFALYGTPHVTDPWGFSLDGPLLSINFTFKGHSFSHLPMLVGAFGEGEDVDVKTSKMITEIGIPSDFLNLFDAEKQQKAIISDEAPEDVIYAYSENLNIIPSGISISEITTQDQLFFFQMMLTVYFNRIHPKMAKEVNEFMLTGHLNEYKFAWRGGKTMDASFYYSFTSSDFLIEFLKTGINSSDVFSVMRQKDYDYGKAFLKS